MEDLSDDYVAQLLAKDAKASATKYSSYGLQAFLPQRSINNAPKPNTRFLRNIIRETDSHNAALRAKEEQEARARLRDLRHNSRAASRSRSRERASREDGGHRPKRRRLDEINGILSGRSQDHRRLKSEKVRNTKSHHDRQTSHTRGGDLPSDSEDKESRIRRDRHSRHHAHRRHERSKSEDGRPQTTNGHRAKAQRRRSRSRSPRSEVGEHERQHRSSRRHRKRSTSPLSGSNDYSSKPTNRRKSHTPSPHTTKDKDKDKYHQDEESSSSSDPLETLGLIGPAPFPSPSASASKITSRGRGAFASPHITTFTASSSAIDKHFTPSYDPTLDTTPDYDRDRGGKGGNDDWEQALEALHDRQKWAAHQAERMRAAGFSEGEIERWGRRKGGGVQRAGEEGREEDVRWGVRGEGREWDRGKVLGADDDDGGGGGVETGVEWGRLKGA